MGERVVRIERVRVHAPGLDPAAARAWARALADGSIPGIAAALLDVRAGTTRLDGLEVRVTTAGVVPGLDDAARAGHALSQAVAGRLPAGVPTDRRGARP